MQLLSTRSAPSSGCVRSIAIHGVTDSLSLLMCRMCKERDSVPKGTGIKPWDSFHGLGAGLQGFQNQPANTVALEIWNPDKLLSALANRFGSDSMAFLSIVRFCNWARLLEDSPRESFESRAQGAPRLGQPPSQCIQSVCLEFCSPIT